MPQAEPLYFFTGQRLLTPGVSTQRSPERLTPAASAVFRLAGTANTTIVVLAIVSAGPGLIAKAGELYCLATYGGAPLRFRLLPHSPPDE